MTTALDGVRVLDCSGIASFGTMILADFGAEVTKVGPVPDALRHPRRTTGSRWDPEQQVDAARGAAYDATQRGKRSILLNLKDEAAREVIYKLIPEMDVFVESFRPGVTTRLGVDYDTLSAINPRLIYCALTGYGQTGPYRDRPGHDLNYNAVGGALDLMRRPGPPPTIPINLLADFGGGAVYVALSVCLALLARERTGRGQYIDMAMADGVLALQTALYSGFFESGETVKPGEYFLNGGVPFYEVYECADGSWISVACLEPHFFRNLCDALELDEFRDRQFDPAVHGPLRERLSTLFAERSCDEWIDHFAAHDVCVAPVLEMPEVVTNEQIQSRSMITDVNSAIGAVRQIGVAPKLSETPGQPGPAGPRPGQHTDEVLAGLGLDETTIAALRTRGAIA